REDMLAEVIFELLSRDHFDQPPRDVGARAVVPALARVEQQRASEWIGLAGPRLEVAPDRARERIGEAGGVGEEVPHGRLPRGRAELVFAGGRVERLENLQALKLGQ